MLRWEYNIKVNLTEIGRESADCVCLAQGMLCFFTMHCSLRLIVRSELDVPIFATRPLHACHHTRAPSDGRWNCGREISVNFA